MKILCKFPTRERPTRFKDVLSAWVNMADDPNGIVWLFSFDNDDPVLENLTEFAIMMPNCPAQVFTGLSSNKIHAINRDIEKVRDPWDILVVLSDDMVPTRKGWDTIIRTQMEHYAPDGDAIIWFFDGKQADIVTLPIMGRKYYDRFGYVYHPDYVSVFADNEQTDVARDLGKLFYFSNPIAHHRHPANFSDVQKDALYLKNETQAIWDRDQATYNRRKAQGFPA